MNEYEKSINKAKKMFYEKENQDEVEKKINKLFVQLLTKGILTKTDIGFRKKIIEIIYEIEINVKIEYPKITPFNLRTIFYSCLYALDERIFFKATMGDIKGFDKKVKEIKDLVENAKPFIRGTVIPRIPSNPNAIYLDTHRYLLEVTPISDDTATALLNIVYDKKSKAKRPKPTLLYLINRRDFYLQLAKSEPESTELQSYLDHLNQLIKNYK